MHLCTSYSRPLVTLPTCPLRDLRSRPATSPLPSVFNHCNPPMKISLLALALLPLLLATTATQAVPEGDKPARKDAPGKRAGNDARQDFLKDHPELKATLEKLKDMSPEERQAWLKAHPEIAEKLKERMKDAGPDRRQDFLKDHPELKEHIEKLKSMTPEERQAWLKEHPEIAAKIEKAKAGMKDRGDNLTPEQKEKLREKMKERFENMTPEQKAEALKKHPELKEKLEAAKK